MSSSSKNTDDPMTIDPPDDVVLFDVNHGSNIESPKKESSNSSQIAVQDNESFPLVSTPSTIEADSDSMRDDDSTDVAVDNTIMDPDDAMSSASDEESSDDGDDNVDADACDESSNVEQPSTASSNKSDSDIVMMGGSSKVAQAKLEEPHTQHESDSKDAESKSDESSKTLEIQLRDSLSHLEKIVDDFVSGKDAAADQDDLAIQLHKLSRNSHNEIKRYGSAIEMGSLVDNDDSSSSANIAREPREFLRDTGKKLWMTIRNHSSLFRDHLTCSQKHDSREKKKENTNVAALDGDRAMATGYIRAIASRLILIDYIRTKDINEPCLVIDSSNSLSKVSVSELEFGVRCFARSGRALLAHGDDPNSAFDSLLLSIKFWEALVMMAEAKQQDGQIHNEAREAVEKMLDEVFDVFLLVPDAASLLPLECNKGTRTIDQLRLLKAYVEKCCEGHNGLHAGLDTDLVVKRYLPALAKTAYKHGNRFSTNKEYSNSRDALQIALETTESCLEYIHNIDQASGSSNSSVTVSPFFTQEHEMLVVSKECFYVLSSVLKCLGQKANAHKCLDQLETYINRQAELDEKVFVSTMKACDGGKDVGAINDPIFALEGLDGDLADIKARAQTAKARTTFTEAKERSNLAFSRIMLDHRSTEPLTESDSMLVDKRFGELAKLSVKLTGSDKHIATSREEFNPLKLVLEAARTIRIRQIQETSKTTIKRNPYNVLLQLYSSTDMKIRVGIDHLKVMIASMVENQTSPNAELDMLCIQTAQDIANRVTSKKVQSRHSDSDLIPDSETGLRILMKESQTCFAEALSLYRSHGSHKHCIQWADFLIQALLNFREFSDFSTISKLSLDEMTSQSISDILAVKALALSNISQSSRCSSVYAEALKLAREAWKLGQSFHSLAILFHCGVLSETHPDGLSSGETLMELDNALATMKTNSDPTRNTHLLDLFSALSTCCAENHANILLLGVQERWLKIKIDVLDGNLSDVLSATLEPSNPVFSILRAYLRNFELLDETSEPQSNGLIHCLKDVLRLIITLRDKTSNPMKNNASDNNTPFPLIWDTDVFKNAIGSHKDCVWIAEQLWNLGIVATSSFAVDILSAAHDFALLAEEEDGMSLTKGHLDVEKTTTINAMQSDMTSYKSLLAREKNMSACELCSEFSSQCLLVSVATEVDRTAKEPSKNKILRRRKHNLIRLYLASRELNGCERPDLHREYVEGLVSWLELRCLILIGDDALCSNELSTGNLLLRLSASSLKDLSQHSSSCSEEKNQNQQDRTKPGHTLVATSVLSHVLVASYNAKFQHMSESAKKLLQFITKEMMNRDVFGVTTPDGRFHSLGQLQRTLVRLGSNVVDTISSFGSIDSLVKKYCGTRSQKVKHLHCYSTEELDWFAVEAYNRGLRLFNLGDSNDAEKLIAVALNLVPFCGKEVESFATDMRQTFAIVVKGKVSKDCASSDSLMNLFCRT